MCLAEGMLWASRARRFHKANNIFPPSLSNGTQAPSMVVCKLLYGVCNAARTMCIMSNAPEGRNCSQIGPPLGYFVHSMQYCCIRAVPTLSPTIASLHPLPITCDCHLKPVHVSIREGEYHVLFHISNLSIYPSKVVNRSQAKSKVRPIKGPSCAPML